MTKRSKNLGLVMPTAAEDSAIAAGIAADADTLEITPEMAATMQDNDVFVIFPEGQHWTPTRRTGLITRLRERGDTALARERLLAHIGHVEAALNPDQPLVRDRLRESLAPLAGQRGVP